MPLPLPRSLRRWFRNILLVAAAPVIFSGCAVGPDYVKPTVSQPSAWIDSGVEEIRSDPGDLARWWTIFNDPMLDKLIEHSATHNPGLHVAGLRILEARARLGILIGNRYPQLQQARGNLSAVGGSENSANSTPNADFRYGELDVGFDAGWEMDFWGKFSKAVNSGASSLKSSIAEYDDTLVTLTAEVARTYVLLRTLETRLAIAHENVAIQERSLQIANVRFQAGDVTELDVAQAKTLLTNTQASVPRLESQIRQTGNTLAFLLGILPSELSKILEGPSVIPEVPSEVAIGIPAEMLRRRPDIRRIEHQMLAQSELIGVAQADLYPHFSLVGSIGLRTSDSGLTASGFPGGSSYGDLFSTDSIEYFVGPGFSWDVLNYGRIKNSVRIEDARFQQLSESYRSTVLKAAREVESGIIGYLRTQDEYTFLRASSEAATRSVDLAMLQYREGLADYQRVLETQRSLVQQQDLVVATKGDIAISLISLYKALGGGWESQLDKPFVPAAITRQMRERSDWGELLPAADSASPQQATDRTTENLHAPYW